MLQVLALPLSCDASMPDYIVKADVFEKGMKRHWHVRDRFRMFFATSYAHKAGELPCPALLSRQLPTVAMPACKARHLQKAGLLPRPWVLQNVRGCQLTIFCMQATLVLYSLEQTAR